MKNKNKIFIVLLCFLLALSLLLNLSLGQVFIPFKEILKSIFMGGSNNSTWDYIILNFRIPKAITAVLVGIGLSISGLLMQTLFRNPLAGPYVLGLSSGSSLGVAFILLGSSFLPASVNGLFASNFSIVLASCMGSLVVLGFILMAIKKLRDTSMVLIVGLMFSSFSGAIINVLSYFSNAEQLQKYTFWSMGSIGNLTLSQLVILGICVFIGLAISMLSLKSLDAMLLGENYAKSIGVNISKSRLWIIIATAIFAGSITAFAGPIAFVGMAVPHIAKLILQTSSHKTVLVATLLLGAIIMLLCDLISQMPGANFTLPINAVTSMIGAPMVIWLISKRKFYRN
ncbi:MAG: iron ABC transporter permease [Flavobacterium sp.]|nr:iron ABC transporter permease [Flavobacterium sp.]